MEYSTIRPILAKVVVEKNKGWYLYNNNNYVRQIFSLMTLSKKSCLPDNNYNRINFDGETAKS